MAHAQRLTGQPAKAANRIEMEGTPIAPLASLAEKPALRWRAARQRQIARAQVARSAIAQTRAQAARSAVARTNTLSEGASA